MMNLTERVIKKVFLLGGYELTKLPDQLNTHEGKRNTSGLTVDLVGPTGVGKTTFFSALEPDLKKDWFFRGQIPRKKLEKKRPFRLVHGRQQDFVGNLLQKKHENLSKIVELSLARREYLYNFFVKEMEQDIFFRYSNLPKGYFSEDGITHGFTNEIVDLMQGTSPHDTGDNCLEEFFGGRAIIQLAASADYIIENLKKRSIETPGRANDWYTHFGKNRIKNFVDDTITNKNKLVCIAEKNGAKVLKINAEDSVTINREKVFEFLRLYISEFSAGSDAE